MILYLADNVAIARAVKRELASRLKASRDGRNTGPDRRSGETRPNGNNRLNGDSAAHYFEVLLIPERLTTAAGFTGKAIAEYGPRIAVIITRIIDDESDRTGVIYRCETVGEVWIPDVLFDHGEKAICVTSRSSADTRPSFSSSEKARAGVARCNEREVSTEAAAALASSIALLSPGRVIALTCGNAGMAWAASAAPLLASKACSVYERLLARRGGDAVSSALDNGGRVADQLRFTKTQRFRFLASTRAAAVRSGEVPEPLTKARVLKSNGKPETKRHLDRLEREFNEWQRPEI